MMKHLLMREADSAVLAPPIATFEDGKQSLGLAKRSPLPAIDLRSLLSSEAVARGTCLLMRGISRCWLRWRKRKKRMTIIILSMARKRLII